MRVRLAIGLVAVLFCIVPVHAEHETPIPPVSSEEVAYEFLKSLPREWSGSSAIDCRTYEEKNIDGLAPHFAGSAADFLKAFVAIHSQVTITSAHRTAQEQRCVCIGEKGPCAGKPRVKKAKKGKKVVVRGGSSRHQHGVALDVRPGTGTDREFACLHEFAKLNPQFGVHFPLGSRDRPHMEPAPRRPTKVASFGSNDAVITPCSAMGSPLRTGMRIRANRPLPEVLRSWSAAPRQRHSAA